MTPGWKLVTVGAVSLFLGSLLTGLLWASQAARTRDLPIIAHTFEGLRRADRWFTLPGAIAIVVAGIMTTAREGVSLLAVGWVVWTIGFFGIALLIVVTVRSGLQRDLAEFARTETADDVSWQEYALMSRYWRLWSVAAIAATAVAVAVAAYRVPLPGF